MKKLILTLSLSSLLAIPSLAGTNAYLVFRTNDWKIRPSGVLDSNAVDIWNAIINAGLGNASGNSGTPFNPAQGYTNNGVVVITNLSLGAGILNGTLPVTNLPPAVATLASNLNTGLTNAAGQTIAAAISASTTALGPVITNAQPGVTLPGGIFSGTGTGLTNVNKTTVIAAGYNGIVGGGVTDDTVAIQNVLNLGGNIYVTSNRFLVQELQITNNTCLWGPGTFVYAKGAANTNICLRCGLNTNITLKDFSIDGGDYNNYDGGRSFVTTAFGTVALAMNQTGAGNMYTWAALGYRHGLQINTDAGGEVSGVAIHNFNGCGFIPLSQFGGGYSYYANKTTMKGINCFSNFVGFWSSADIGNLNNNPYVQDWTSNYVQGAAVPEYCSYSQMDFNNNSVGMVFNSGNCTMAASHVDGNFIGQINANGANPNHGVISSTTFNHNINGLIYMVGDLSWGEQYIGCQFLGNSINNNGTGYNIPIVLYLVTGCAFDNCKLQYFALTNTATPTGGTNFFRNNLYQGNWSQQNLSTDGQLVYYCNNSYSGGANDGQPLTLLQTGNGAGVTGIPATGIVGTAVTNLQPTTVTLNNSLGSAGILLNGSSGIQVLQGSLAVQGSQVLEGPATNDASALIHIPASQLTGASTNQTFAGTNTLTGAWNVPDGAAITLVNGENGDLDIGTNSYVILSGPTSSFNIDGFVAKANGRTFRIANPTGQQMTIRNRSGLDATAANRIITGNNSDLIFKNNPAVVEFRYLTSSNAWIITGFNSLSPLSLPAGILTNDFGGTIHATAFNADQDITAGQQITANGGINSVGFESAAFFGQADPMGGDPIMQLAAQDSTLVVQVDHVGDVSLLNGNDLTVTGTIYASNAISGNAGFASFATNIVSVAATGYTNLGTNDVEFYNLQGTNIIYTNLNSGFQVIKGTITTPQYIHLKPNTGVFGLRMAGDGEGH